MSIHFELGYLSLPFSYLQDQDGWESPGDYVESKAATLPFIQPAATSKCLGSSRNTMHTHGNPPDSTKKNP